MSMNPAYRIYRPLAGGGRVILGHAVEYDQGWKFIPANAVNKPSRKFHPTVSRCLPRWVSKYYEYEVVSHETP